MLGAQRRIRSACLLEGRRPRGLLIEVRRKVFIILAFRVSVLLRRAKYRALVRQVEAVNGDLSPDQSRFLPSPPRRG